MIGWILTVIFVFLFIKYNMSRLKIYKVAREIKGPFALPIIGNAALFMGNPDDALMKVLGMIKKHGSFFRFWLGPDLIIVISKPHLAKKVLSSNKITHKHKIYDAMKFIIGDGLISGSGPKVKHARSIAQPIYNAKYVSSILEIFQKHVKICIGKLEEKVDKPTFNIHSIVHSCVSDIIAESILGIHLNTQKGENRELAEALDKVYNVLIPKMTKPWLNINFIYNWTNYKVVQDRCTEIVFRNFKNLFEKYKTLSESPDESILNNNQFLVSAFTFTKECLENPGPLTETDIIHNLITIYMASEDTVAQIASAAILCFGMYPKYQEKAAQEIKTILGDNTTNITYDDVLKLQYLDMCVKEVLRLFPIAPFILRQTTEDFQIDKYNIPEGCAILLSVFSLHLDPEQWERPMEFYPNHFTPEAIKTRHNFSFLPFSAGPRGCIGKLVAQTSIKVMLANILQKYVIEADGTYENVFKELKSDVSVRVKTGFQVRLKKRNCC